MGLAHSLSKLGRGFMETDGIENMDTDGEVPQHISDETREDYANPEIINLMESMTEGVTLIDQFILLNEQANDDIDAANQIIDNSDTMGEEIDNASEQVEDEGVQESLKNLHVDRIYDMFVAYNLGGGATIKQISRGKVMQQRNANSVTESDGSYSYVNKRKALEEVKLSVSKMAGDAWNSIKNIIRRILNFIKASTAKIMNYFNKSGAQIDAMLKRFKDVRFDFRQLDGDFIKSLTRLRIVRFLLGGHSKTLDTMLEDLKTTAEALAKAKQAGNGHQSEEQAFEAAEKAIADYMQHGVKDADFAKLENRASKLLKEISKHIKDKDKVITVDDINKVFSKGEQMSPKSSLDGMFKELGIEVTNNVDFEDGGFTYTLGCASEHTIAILCVKYKDDSKKALEFEVANVDFSSFESELMEETGVSRDELKDKIKETIQDLKSKPEEVSKVKKWISRASKFDNNIENMKKDLQAAKKAIDGTKGLIDETYNAINDMMKILDKQGSLNNREDGNNKEEMRTNIKMLSKLVPVTGKIALAYPKVLTKFALANGKFISDYTVDKKTFDKWCEDNGVK